MKPKPRPVRQTIPRSIIALAAAPAPARPEAHIQLTATGKITWAVKVPAATASRAVSLALMEARRLADAVRAMEADAKRLEADAKLDAMARSAARAREEAGLAP